MSNILSPINALKLSNAEREALANLVEKLNEHLISRARECREFSFDIPSGNANAVVMALIADMGKAGWKDIIFYNDDEEDVWSLTFSL